MARIKVRDVLINEGVDIPADVKIKDCPEAMDMLQHYVNDAECPACCDEGCYVEPDGHCEHGHPSVLLALKLL